MLDDLVDLRAKIGLSDEDGGSGRSDVFKKRTEWFLVDNERNKRVSVRIDDKFATLPKSGKNGHFSGQVLLDDAVVQRIGVRSDTGTATIEFEAVLPEGRSDVIRGRAFIVPRSGLSVISDIDDTIKVSNVLEKRELLKNTFVRPFRAVPGMQEVYRKWAAEKSATFHYVSASPWQLYPALGAFLIEESGFPAGTFHMKDFRWKDETFLNLFMSGEDYKVMTISQILERFPGRRFVLVGDSGEKDPEAYGELARWFPGWVVRILIRKVTKETPNDERYRRAFRDLPKDLWTVFEDPSEIRNAVR